MTEEEKLKALWQIIRELAICRNLVVNDCDAYECAFCDGYGDTVEHYIHDDLCIVTKARALVAQQEQ